MQRQKTKSTNKELIPKDNLDMRKKPSSKLKHGKEKAKMQAGTFGGYLYASELVITGILVLYFT